jgi:hypothetical protein
MPFDAADVMPKGMVVRSPCFRVGFLHRVALPLFFSTAWDCLDGASCRLGELAQQAQWAIYLVAAAVCGVLRVMAASQIIHARLRSHDAMMSIECAESKPSVPATQPSAT